MMAFQLSGRRNLPARLALGVVLVLLSLGSPAAATTLPSGFSETIYFSGLLTEPTAVRFSPDGRIFITEKSGLIKVFDNLTDTTPTVFADLRTNVHNYWDRGLVGLALDPNFPATPYVYVGYTLDAPIGGTPPVWGTPGATSDSCPSPPGPTTNGCVVSGRLSRLQASGNVMTGAEQVLIGAWCQQFPSHSVDSVVFGPDGALYVSAGEGANFFNFDYGQFGSPTNPCGDPPVGVGGTQAPPGAEGGSLRAQSVRRNPGEPAVLSGAVLRVDPLTGAALSDNPLFGGSRPNADRIIAYGLRNPFRMTFRPGTSELWIGDVGLTDWEEINRLSNPTDPVIENFGWPCYEGAAVQSGFSSLNVNICQTLYATPNAVTTPYYAYNHNDQVVPGESCASGSSSISGLAFYPGGTYPTQYNGALFFADYARSCIWAMFNGANGDPDPTSRITFAAGAATPVDLQVGPGGDLFYVNFNGGDVRRIRALSGGQAPTAVIQANPTYGALPLTVQFDGSASTDPQGGALTYAWDLNGDGQFTDSSAVSPSFTYTTAGTYTAGLRVTNPQAATGTATLPIQAGNTPPSPSIQTPVASTLWNVNDVIAFSGSASDAQDGQLPASALSWNIIIHHCPSNCHTHPLQSFTGVASGSFLAPDHDYPSYLEVQLTATDSRGLTATTSVLINPRTVTLNFDTTPTSGLTLTVGSASQVTPFSRTVILNSAVSLSAPSPQGLGGNGYQFASWSDGGAQNHTITAPAAAANYVATYSTVPSGVCGNGIVESGEQCDDGSSNGPCCSVTCQIVASTTCNLARYGTIIARVTNPGGVGNYNPEVIRDGDMPAAGTADPKRQYDTYDGPNAASEDWIGYTFPTALTFAQVVFQEGMHFSDGGWFTGLTAQVRQNGTWVAVSELNISPTYPGTNNGVSYQTYTLNFLPMTGDGIRIDGAPGGSAAFISVGELQAFGSQNLPTPSSTATASVTATRTRTATSTMTSTATPTATRTATETATTRRSSTPSASPTRTPTATPNPTQTATPTATASGPCGNGVIDSGEQCDDGASNGTCCSATCQIVVSTTCNLARYGTIVARVTSPAGVGSYNLEVIRDSDMPPVGSFDSKRQYDTYDGPNSAPEDWIGYTFPVALSVGRIVFQEGMHFSDGGWFTTLTAQVRQNGAWVAVSGVTISPAYPGTNNGTNYETYTLNFPPITGDGIRIDGAPGGSAAFISVGELQVFGSPISLTPSATATASAASTATRTATATGTPTASPSATPSTTRTATSSSTPSITATPTRTPTATATATSTVTATASFTATSTATATATRTPTQTPTPTPTSTLTQTPTTTPTSTPANTATATSSSTPTRTATATATRTSTATQTATTASPPTATNTVALVPSPTPTNTPVTVACGNTSFGTGADTNDANFVQGPSCITGNNSAGYSIRNCVARVGSVAAGAHIKCAIYTDAGHKLCEAASPSAPVANAWNTIDLSTANCGTLARNTRYWITFNTDDSTLQWLSMESVACSSATYPTCSNCSRYQPGQTFPSFPEPWGPIAANCQFSYYVNLQAQ